MATFDEQPFDPMKSLALNYLLAAAPLVAEHLHIQDAVEILKIAVTQYMLETRKLTVDEAAAQLSRSQRWTYKHRYLIQSLVSLRDRLPLHLEMLDWFVHRREEGGTLQELQRYLAGKQYQASEQELAALLAAYRKTGYLEANGDVYRWGREAKHTHTAEVVGRAARASGMVGIFTRLLRSHVDTSSGYMRHIHVTLTRGAYEEMVRDIKAATEKAFKKAVARSWEEAPEGYHQDGVVVDGILMMGCSPYRPDKRE